MALRRKKTKNNTAKSRHKDTMTCRELAYESGLGLQTIYQALRGGDLPYRKIGNRQVVSRIAYQGWLARFGKRSKTTKRKS